MSDTSSCEVALEGKGHLTDAFPVSVAVICGSLPDIYVEKLLGFVAACLEKSGHLQFYLSWAQNLLMLHGQKLKNRSVSLALSVIRSPHVSVSLNIVCVSLVRRSVAILPTLQALQKSIQRHFDSLSKL